MKRVLVAVGLAAALVSPAAASAKGLTTLTICGAGDQCRRFHFQPFGAPHRSLVAGVSNAFAATESVALPRPQPYYRLRLDDTVGGSVPGWYAPEAGLVKGPNGWTSPASAVQAELRAVTEDLGALDEPKPASVRVNGVPSETPSVYVPLLDELPQADGPPAGTPTALVELRYGTTGAWTDARLDYAPTENVVRRDGRWAAVPAKVAARIEADLRQEGVASRNGWASALVFGLVLTGALFVGWLTFVRRKWWKTGGRRRPRVSPPPEGEAPRSSPRR